MRPPPSDPNHRAIRVFLSYAWESEEYRTFVKRFALRLIEDGIDVRLDVWHTRSGQTVPEFISSENRHADKILIVCSPEYRTKVHAMEDGEQISGVGYESMLTTSTLWTGERRREDVEVVLLSGSRNESIPDFISGLEYIDLTNPQTFEQNYRELLRRLTGRRERAPAPGRLPDLTPESIEPLHGVTPSVPPLQIQRPGIASFALDRILPTLSRTLRGTPRPPEYQDVVDHLRALRGHIENDIVKKNYIPNSARRVLTGPSADQSTGDPFVRPIHQVIRSLIGRAEGGDSATAQIAAVNRRSKIIHDIVKLLVNTDDPLVLLGEPGTGKSLTLQQAAISLITTELRRVYPAVPLFVRLGEFHRNAQVNSDDVLDYVKESAPARIRPWIDALDRAGRLVILFDGMDEMSREFYTAHTEALSEFASSRKGLTKTLFSCRITDFSPSFVHQRLVLLPFGESQIAEYLHRYFASRFVVIEGKRWKIKKLAEKLLRDSSIVDASNPFTLWLLCFHFARQGRWPESRTALLEFYLEESFNRKRDDVSPQLSFPPFETIMGHWARLAYQITLRNQGAAIPLSELGMEPVIVRIGRLCGVLAESAEWAEALVRFEHHRLQEYFTARHIRNANPSIDWLDKLDAPRWQETLVNLVIMGGGDKAVATLSSAILSEIGQAPEAPIPHDRELLLADRVELAARIARMGSASRAGSSLMPAVVESVEFLMDRGNPITHMKMMRACAPLPDPRLVAAIRRPLSSKIDWLKEQALILLSASEQRGGASLPAEVGYDLANGVLLIRIAAYKKAIRASHQRGALRSLLFGLFAVFIELLASAVVGALLYRTVLAGVATPSDPWLRAIYYFLASRWGAIATAGIVIGTAAIVLRKAPEYLWSAIIASILAVPVVAFGLPALWRAPSLGGGLFFMVAVALLLGAPVLTVAVGLLHSGLVAGYLLTTRPFREKEDRRALLVQGSWERCGFLWWTKYTIAWVPITLAVVGPLLLGIGGLLHVIVVFVKSLFPTGFLESVGSVLSRIWNVIAILVAVVGLVVVLIRFILKVRETLPNAYKFGRDSRFRRARLMDFNRMIKDRLPVWGKIAAIVVGVTLLPWLLFTEGALIAHVVVVVVLLAIMALLVRQSYQLLTFGQEYSFSNRSFTEDSWHDALKRADPYEQEYIISETNYETLGLDPAQFLTAFQNAQPFIHAEPALSAYWARRNKLEEVLKQERGG